jgi:hypothetical protein
MLLQRLFLIEVFPALAFPCADLRQAHKDRMEALGDISRRRINGWSDHTHLPNGFGGGQLSPKGVGDPAGTQPGLKTTKVPVPVTDGSVCCLTGQFAAQSEHTPLGVFALCT